jgi:hypothetical protein
MASIFAIPHHTSGYVHPIVSKWLVDYIANNNVAVQVMNKASLWGTTTIDLEDRYALAHIIKALAKEGRSIVAMVNEAMCAALDLPPVVINGEVTFEYRNEDLFLVASVILGVTLKIPLFCAKVSEEERRTLGEIDFNTAAIDRVHHLAHVIDEESVAKTILRHHSEVTILGGPNENFVPGVADSRTVLVYADTPLKLRTFIGQFVIPAAHLREISGYRNGGVFESHQYAGKKGFVTGDGPGTSDAYGKRGDFGYILRQPQVRSVDVVPGVTLKPSESNPVVAVEHLLFTSKKAYHVTMQAQPQAAPVDEDTPPRLLTLQNRIGMHQVISTEMAERLIGLASFQLTPDLEKFVGTDRVSSVTTPEYRDDFVGLRVILNCINGYGDSGEYLEPTMLSPCHVLADGIVMAIAPMIDTNDSIDGFADVGAVMKYVTEETHFTMAMITDSDYRCVEMRSSNIPLATLAKKTNA